MIMVEPLWSENKPSIDVMSNPVKHKKRVCVRKGENVYWSSKPTTEGSPSFRGGFRPPRSLLRMRVPPRVFRKFEGEHPA